MVERIRQLLDARKLTPTQFADTIGVARPIVSHILSGRNKPSLEVVQKVIEAFPDLSLAWLLRGVGEMLATAPTPTDVSPRAIAPSPDSPEKTAVSPPDTRSARQSAPTASRAAERLAAPLFDGSDEASELLTVTKPSNSVETAFAPATTAASIPSATVTASSLTGISPSSNAAPTTQPRNLGQTDSGALPASAAIAFAEPNKAIRRIVIFYQDGTFTDYRPEA